MELDAHTLSHSVVNKIQLEGDKQPLPRVAPASSPGLMEATSLPLFSLVPPSARPLSADVDLFFPFLLFFFCSN